MRIRRGGETATLDLDVPAATVSVAVTVAGEPVSDVTMTTTFLTLKNDAGDAAKLTVTSESGASTTPVLPGTYDLYYSAYGIGDGVPKNSSVEIERGIVVESSPVSLTVDIPASVVSGRVTVNGAALSAPESEPVLALQGIGDDRVEISVDADGAFRTVVVPGTYDLLYVNPRGTAGVPVNVSAVLRRGVVIDDAALTLDVDIPATTVSGDVTLNGETVTGASEDGSGYLFLVGEDSTHATLSSLHAGSYSTLVVRGTYDLYYGSAGRDLRLPVNRRAKLETGIIVGDTPLELDWDIEAVRVDGTVLVNGAPIPNPEVVGGGEISLEAPDGDNGRLAFTSSESTDPEDLAAGAYSVLVIPGSYELYYRVYNGGGWVLPANVRAHLGCFEVRR